MTKCRHTTIDWTCPLDALLGEEYCYWHKKENEKKPDDAKLRELKENEILEAFLRKAKLERKDLQSAVFRLANLKGADLQKANLEGTDLFAANLEGAGLGEANLKGANLECVNLKGAHLWEANLKGANLGNANLKGAQLLGANFEGAHLLGANLERTNLRLANLKGADLQKANLEGTDLFAANLEGANLGGANLKGTNLLGANLKGANLYGVRVDSGTHLEEADLTYANLYHSYLDETKTLRNAKFEKEINEVVADSLKKENKLAVLDIARIEKVSRLYEEGLVRYVLKNDRIVFFDKKRKCFVRIPRNEGMVERIKKIFRLRKKEDLEENCVEIGELKLIEGGKDYFYKRNRKELYEASYDVYNTLYNFYIQNGKIEEALKMHYKRCEVRRKLLRECGGINCLRSWIYDFLILKLLTGYGVKISRPLIASALIILVFALLFKFTNGIVKIVNGKTTPDFLDYFYHSVITFTSLGYANIQPNLMVGHIPQILSAIESCLGALMIALLIFTITYRVSR